MIDIPTFALIWSTWSPVEVISVLGVPTGDALACEQACSQARDAHITRVLGMGMPETRGCPYHCDIALNDKGLVPIPTVT